jgi:16S rRNA C1402 (ribose-2'-O) methylase RsmI
MYEMHYRGTVEEALAYFTHLTIKGEFVLVVGKEIAASSDADNL